MVIDAAVDLVVDADASVLCGFVHRLERNELLVREDLMSPYPEMNAAMVFGMGFCTLWFLGAITRRSKNDELY